MNKPTHRLAPTRLAACALALLLAAAAQAQPVQLPDWQRSTPGTQGVALALDATDNVYTAGVIASTAFDAGTGTLVLSRYAANGTLQWTQNWNGGATWLGASNAGLRVRAVTTDAAGNAFVIGDLMFLNTSVSADGGPSTVVGVAPYGWMALKFGPDGTLLWASRQMTTASNWVGVRAVADAAGDLYALVDPGSAGMVMRTVKLSGATGALLWLRGTPDGAKPGRIAVTPRGTVVASMASKVWGLSLVEYDPATGAELSRSAYPAASGYYAPGLAVGTAGQFVVGGTSSDGSSTFIAGQDANHAPLFERTLAPGVSAPLVAIDAAGAVLAASASGGTDPNWATQRTDSLGNATQPAWIVNRSATAPEAPRDLVITSDGAVVVAGAAGIPGGTATATQATTVRYGADGSIAWTAAVPGATTVVDLAAGRDGSVFALADTAQTLLHYRAAVAVPLPVPQALTLSRTSVRGGTSVTGGVGVSTTAGVVVRLTSSHPAIVAVPASVTVPAGSTAVAFAIRTARPRTTTAVTITATANGKSASAVLGVSR